MPTRNLRSSATTARPRAEAVRAIGVNVAYPSRAWATSPGSDFLALVGTRFFLSGPPAIRVPGDKMPGRGFTGALGGQTVVVAFPSHQCGAHETGNETDPEANQCEKHPVVGAVAMPVRHARGPGSREAGISRVMLRRLPAHSCGSKMGPSALGRDDVEVQDVRASGLSPPLPLRPTPGLAG
jgi:hypothetical protein